MKARLKESNDEFKKVISLKQNLVELSDGHVYHIHRLEFEPDRWQEPCKLNPENDLSNPIDHWQEVRERAAIAAIQAFCAAPVTKDTKSITIDDATKFAVEIADALVKKLKGE